VTLAWTPYTLPRRELYDEVWMPERRGAQCPLSH
jgi:hypothetical protein